MRTREGSRQLYVLSDADFEAPNFVDPAGKLHTCVANNIPLMIWPDGGWCHPGNRYMRELFEKGRSRRNRGGSLAVAAAHISQLLRYCYFHRSAPVDLLELTEDDFRAFVKVLELEPDPLRPGEKRRDANSVIAIGRTCLGFLASAGAHAGNPWLVSPEGQIRGTRRLIEVRDTTSSSPPKTIEVWDHTALPSPDPKKRRLPIATAKIEEMRAAVAKVSTTSHQRARRHLILLLLEITGARRGEIAEITIGNVVKAASMQLPMLKVPTLKKRRSEERYVPISRHDIAFILQYVEVHRRSIVRRKCAGKDHGILLVSEIDGQPITPNTITQEIRILRLAAGIGEKACPHMFRHRFLTKLFVALIEQHNIENKDEFRRLLLESEALKKKVAEWTGQSISALQGYIDLAFEEVGSFKRVYNLVTASLAIDSFAATIAAELDAIDAGEQPLLILQRLKYQLEQFKIDIANAKEAA